MMLEQPHFFPYLSGQASGFIKHGLSIKRFVTLIALSIACYLTKSTVSLALILAIIPIIFGLSRQARQRYAWYALILIALFSLVSIFAWGDAANWARDNSFQIANTRAAVGDAPVGENSFTITKAVGESSHQINQFLSYRQAQSLQGKKVTLGAWIWADKPMSIRSPRLRYDEQEKYIDINISSEKHFYAFSTKIPKDTLNLYVMLSSLSKEPDISGTIYFDGIILAEGNYDTTQTPILNNTDARSGQWGGSLSKTCS